MRGGWGARLTQIYHISFECHGPERLAYKNTHFLEKTLAFDTSRGQPVTIGGKKVHATLLAIKDYYIIISFSIKTFCAGSGAGACFLGQPGRASRRDGVRSFVREHLSSNAYNSASLRSIELKF